MIDLYHAEPVANSLKVLLTMKEKGIDFTSHYVDILSFEQHEPWFVAINPNGQVPVLVHDGEVITESTVINEYLEDVFPAVPLRPEDPVKRARMRFWNKYVDEYVMNAVSMHGWHRMVRRIASAIDKDELARLLARIPLKEQRDKWATVAGDSFTEEQLADSKRKIGVATKRMDETLQRQQYLASEQYTLADINAFAHAGGTQFMFPDLVNEATVPGFIRWWREIAERPGTKAALAMPNKVPEKLRTFGVAL